MKEIKVIDVNKLTELNLHIVDVVKNHANQIKDKSIEMFELKRKIAKNYREITNSKFNNDKTVFKNVVIMRLVQYGINRCKFHHWLCDVTSAKLITYNNSMHIDCDELFNAFDKSTEYPDLKKITEELKLLTLIQKDDNTTGITFKVRKFSESNIAPSQIFNKTQGMPRIFNGIDFNLDFLERFDGKHKLLFTLVSALKTSRDGKECELWYSDDPDVCFVQKIVLNEQDGLEYLTTQDEHHIRGDVIINMELIEQQYQDIESELLSKMTEYNNNLDMTLKVLKEYCMINNI